MTRNPRSRRPTDPTAYGKWLHSRRAEIVREAAAQAEANGLDAGTHRDLLSAMVWNECTERASGGPERTKMLFDWEMEILQREKTRDALDQLIAIIREAAEEYFSNSSG